MDGPLAGVGGDVEAMHEVGGVGGVGGAVGVAHEFAVAVVGGDEEPAAEFEHFFDDEAHAEVDGLAGVDAGLNDASVANHVGVGVVHDDEVVTFQTADHFKREIRGAHLRLLVVGGHFLRADGEVAVFPRIRLLKAAVEEEGDVRVFLRFRRTKLRESGGCDDLAEVVPQRLGAEDDAHTEVGVGGVVFGEGVVTGLGSDLAIKTIKPGLEKCFAKLAGTVSAEVEPQDDIVITNALLVGIGKDHGQEKLITTRVALIRGLNRGARCVGAHLTAPEHDGIPGEFVAIPALVAVHGIVAADDGGDFGTAGFEVGFQLCQVTSAARGRGVAAIGDGVDHEVLHTRGFCGIAECHELVLMRMHAAIADEAEKVQALALGFFESLDEHWHLGEFAVADALIDAGEILINDAPGAKIEVADFAIAHLAVGQADIFTAGADGATWVGGVKVVVKGGLGEQGGVAIGNGLGFAAGVDAPAITDNQNNGFFGHKECLSALLVPSRAGNQGRESPARVRTFALGADSDYKRPPFPRFSGIPVMTPGLLSKLPQITSATLVFALASVAFDTVHSEDKPGFFKKIFGGDSKTQTPPESEKKSAPASKPKAEPAQTTSKPATPTTGKPPRVIITTTGGGSKKKVEIGKTTTPTTAKTTTKVETPKAGPKLEPIKDVTSTSKRGEGEFKGDDDDKTPAVKTEAVSALPSKDGWEIVKIEGRDYVTAESIRNFYNPVYGFTTLRLQGNHFWLGSSKLILKATVGSQEMLINNIKFILSFPVLSHNGKVLFSRLDLCKLIDPVLYPSHIQNAEYFDTVVVDAGHGGHDAGARGIYGYEKDFALKMAMSVRTALMQRGFKVVLTRANDTFLTLGGRVAIANQTPKSIFLSFHFNSGGSTATGIETWALTPQNASATISRGGGYNLNGVTGNKQDSANIALATAVHASVISRFKFVDRGVKRAQWSVLTGCKRPGILFEGGFLTNGAECLLVASDTYRQQVSAAIGDAVVNYRKALETAMAKR